MEIVRPAREASQPAVSFAIAPAYDLVISLAALADPERFELPASWARAVRTSLSPGARRDLLFFFGDPVPVGVGAIQLVPDLPSAGGEELIAALAALEAPDFVVTLLSRGSPDRALPPAIRRLARRKGGPGDRDVLDRHMEGFRAETRKRIRAIVDDPSGAKERYLGLLRSHHDGWFAAHYPDVMPVVVQRARQGRRSVGKLPTKEVIARVTNGFTLQSPAESVVLAPSYYASPFVLVVRSGSHTVLVYGVRPAEDVEHAPMDAHTVRVLKALADETRLRILQLLARRPLYGQQLAEALGVSHPTISHHMTQLRIAGLTRTELTADGNKAYSVQRETIEELCAELQSAFVTENSSLRETS